MATANNDGAQKPVIIVNPQSAGGQTRRRWGEIEASLRDVLGDFQVRFTERPGHATILAREALRGGADRVLAMGGDGTINEVVNGFFDGDKPVRPGAAFGVLPTGTGGDFIKTLGTPRVLLDAARSIASAKPRPIDVARLTYTDHDGQRAMRHFINITSFGIGGLVDRFVNQSSKALGGKASFFLATVRASLSYKNAHCRIRLDGGKPIDRTIYSVAVANGRFFGGGMMMAPKAEIDDGKFDVVTIGDVPIRVMLLNGMRVYSGTHTELPFVTVERASKVEAEPQNGEEVLLDMDGEQPGRLPATFELLPKAIGVVA